MSALYLLLIEGRYALVVWSFGWWWLRPGAVHVGRHAAADLTLEVTVLAHGA